MTISKSGSVWTVDGNLLIVDTESVSVSVRVGEESSLKHFVFRRQNTRDQVTRSESSLLDLSKVVLGVFVEDKLSDIDKRVVTMRPNLCNIEDIPSIV